MKSNFAAVVLLAACSAVPAFGQTPQPSPSNGINLQVDCGHKPGKLPSISAALKILSPVFPATVTVSGACNENLLIQGFERLTLISTTGASISDASSGAKPVVDIEDSRTVTVQGFTISGGLDGIDCGNASVCYLTGNTIQSSVGQEGVAVSNGSRGILTGNFIKNNGQRGLTVNEGSQVFSSNDAIQGNADTGVVANSGAYVSTFNTTVQNNGNVGMIITDHSTLRMISGAVSGNTGSGVIVRRGSGARFDSYNGAATITGNSGNGVLVQDLAMGLFTEGANVTGNLSGTDVVCAPQFPATRGTLSNINGGTTNCVEQ